MKLNKIFGVVEYIAAKETEGGTLTIPNRNLLLEEINISLFNEEWKKYEVMRNNPAFKDVIAQSPLVKFMEHLPDVPVGLVGAVSLSLLTNPQYIINLTPKSDLREIEIVSIDEANKRQSGIMFQSPDIRPYAYQQGSYLFVIPYDIGDIVIDYLRLPVTPYYDSCQDAVNYKDVYMPEGSYIDEVLGVNVLYDVDGNLLNASVTKANMNTLPFTSATVELEWKDGDHILFISKILSRMGINLSIPLITQYAEQMNQ